MSIQSVGKFFLTVLLVMLGIYLVKIATAKFQIPILSNIAEGV